ncbi:hypothetical protein MWU59_10700 [Flavobacteriaceae bacterium F08102]|nr:hypothetical protein [Flavobacteriaceae bacterium F08102]
MDIGTTAISASILVACALPFALMYKKKVRRQHRLTDGLQKLAAAKNSKISTKDVYGDFAIGMDEKTNHIFYFKQKIDEVISHSIDLSTMNRCEVKTTYSPFDPKHPQDQEIDRLDLVLYPKSKQMETIALGFYDVDETFQIANELAIAEKWAEFINKQIN